MAKVSDSKVLTTLELPGGVRVAVKSVDYQTDDGGRVLDGGSDVEIKTTLQVTRFGVRTDVQFVTADIGIMACNPVVPELTTFVGEFALTITQIDSLIVALQNARGRLI